MNVSDHINNILNYYNDNFGCDPNVYEYIELCGDLVDYLNNNDNEEINKYVCRKFELLNDMFFYKLKNCNIGVDEKHPLYRLCDDNKKAAFRKVKLFDQDLLKKIGGVSFYILQQQRDVEKGIIDSFKYDNECEFNDLIIMDKIFSKSEKTESNSPREELMLFISSRFKEEYKKENSKCKNKC